MGGANEAFDERYQVEWSLKEWSGSSEGEGRLDANSLECGYEWVYVMNGTQHPHLAKLYSVIQFIKPSHHGSDIS